VTNMMNKRIYILNCATVEGKNEPDYKDYIPDPLARRRMSRIIKMGLTSAMIALKDSGLESIDGIITGTGWGCLADTERFLNSIYENDERLLNPSAFIQSTPNTIGAQIALSLGINCYNVSYVHGGISFESALTDAILMLKEGNDMNLLVGGFDEMSPTKEHILGRMGVWRVTTPGEGAHFFVLGNSFREKALAEIESVTTFNENGALNSDIDLMNILERTGISFDSSCRVLYGMTNRLFFPEQLKDYLIDYKKKCGEYPTASAYALWYGSHLFKQMRDVEKIIIVSRHLKERISVIVIKKISS